MPSTKTASPKAKATTTRAAKAPAKPASAPRTTAAKPAAAKPASRARPAPDLTPAPVVVPSVTVLPVEAGATISTTAAEDATSGATLKKQEMVARVAAASGAKRKDVKRILEATLQVLGEALSKGEELNLPPLGKVKVNRVKADGGPEILTLRLRRSEPGDKVEKPRKEGLAPDGEDD